LRRELKVHIRPATERILAMPKRRHLVPKSLAEFVEAKGRPPVEGAPLHASKSMDESTQDKATKFMLRFFKDAYDATLPKPRITEDAFPACRDAVAGVTEDQMLAAMDQVPEHHKRKRGERDR
jgi:hypothetical protein